MMGSIGNLLLLCRQRAGLGARPHGGIGGMRPEVTRERTQALSRLDSALGALT